MLSRFILICECTIGGGAMMQHCIVTTRNQSARSVVLSGLIFHRIFLACWLTNRNVTVLSMFIYAHPVAPSVFSDFDLCWATDVRSQHWMLICAVTEWLSRVRMRSSCTSRWRATASALLWTVKQHHEDTPLADRVTTPRGLRAANISQKHRQASLTGILTQSVYIMCKNRAIPHRHIWILPYSSHILSHVSLVGMLSPCWWWET